jgi:protein-tyrosine-phosphatase/predicted ATP-grasp superfamily ATP-dependent carboligase
LVLGSDTRSFLTVVRSLGRAGLTVHVAWCDPEGIAARSRYVSRIHDLPEYAVDAPDWKAALLDLLQRQPFDLVIPCDDPSILPLQANRTEFEALAPIYLLSQEAFQITIDKGRTQALAASCGVPVPRSDVVSTEEAALMFGRRFGFPVVVKPASSFTLDDVATKRAVRTTTSGSELTEAIADLRPGENALLQEFIGGVGAGVEILAREGKILVAFQHVRVHEPLCGGGSSYRKSAGLDPRLLEATTKLIHALHYTGVAMVEFRVDDQTGRWVLLEINGRFWGSLPLAVAAGCDFPRYLVEMLIDGRTDFPPSYRVGLFARNWSQDARWFEERFAASGYRRQVLVDLAHGTARAVTGRERSDTMVLDDPIPGLLELEALARLCATSAQRRLRRAIRRSPPAREWTKRRLLARLNRSTSLLFLCKGNICRSAFAEEYARRVLPETYNIRSAGHLSTCAGRPSPDTALAAARKLGIDLSSHTSGVLTQELVECADLILAFDDEQLAAIEQMFPRARRKTHLMGALDETGDPVISDPYGKTEHEFVTTFSTIAALIDLIPGASAAKPVECLAEAANAK